MTADQIPPAENIIRHMSVRDLWAAAERLKQRAAAAERREGELRAELERLLAVLGDEDHAIVSALLSADHTTT